MTRRYFNTLLAASPLLVALPLSAEQLAITSNFTMKYIPPGIHDGVFCNAHGYSCKWKFISSTGKTTYHGIANRRNQRNDEEGFSNLIEEYTDIAREQVHADKGILKPGETIWKLNQTT